MRRPALYLATSAILAAALLLRLHVFFGQSFPLRGDAANYVKLAWSMRYTRELDPTAGIMFSSGYPLFIFLASFIVNNLDTAAVLVSVAFGAASVLMAMLIGRLLFGPRTALASGVGLALFLPHIYVSVAPLSESTYIFFMLLSVYLLASGTVKPKRLHHYALTGLSFGAAFLARPEAQIVLSATGIVSIYILRKKHALPVRRLCLVVVLAAAAFFAVNMPRVIWLHKTTGYWMLDNRKNYIIKFIDRYQDDLAAGKKTDALRDGFEESIYGLSSRGELMVAEPGSFARWLLARPGRRWSYYRENAWTSIRNVNVQVWILIALAVAASWLSAKGERYKLSFLSSTFAPVLFIPLFYSIGGGSWYGRWEPSVQFAPLMVLMGAHGLVLGLERFRAGWRWVEVAAGTVVVLLALYWALPAASYTLNEVRKRGNDEGLPPKYVVILLDKKMGEWIDANLPKEAKIMVRSWTIARYCNRERVMLPYGDYGPVIDYARRKGADYVVAGGADWGRPQLEFLVPPHDAESPYRPSYQNDLELVEEWDALDYEGAPFPYNLAVYRLKK